MFLFSQFLIDERHIEFQVYMLPYHVTLSHNWIVVKHTSLLLINVPILNYYKGLCWEYFKILEDQKLLCLF